MISLKVGTGVKELLEKSEGSFRFKIEPNKEAQGTVVEAFR
jgi:hypothetical protein